MADHRLTIDPARQPARTLRQLAAAACLALATVAAGTTAAATAHADQPADAEQPAHAAETHAYGQDVSNYQAAHDWAASGATFGIVKATEGADFTDRAFARHWAEMGRHGIVRGAYHFAHPSNDPIIEADHFVSVVNRQPARKGDLLALDLEVTDGMPAAHVNAWAKTWLARVKARTGVTPLFYSSWTFAETYGQGLGAYPLWVAHYGKPKGTVTPPAPWKTWTIHQYTDNPIDQNVTSVQLDRLRALGRK
ncbi:MAG TPA: glycoside hydrolase family 25 protein [Nonomuraea sp.]|nr:glycoside hydrolase family 25 protein [Nonomuraea sp.]